MSALAPAAAPPATALDAAVRHLRALDPSATPVPAALAEAVGAYLTAEHALYLARHWHHSGAGALARTVTGEPDPGGDPHEHPQALLRAAAAIAGGGTGAALPVGFLGALADAPDREAHYHGAYGWHCAAADRLAAQAHKI